MKKWIAAALAALLVAGCLSACGKTDVGGLGTDDRLSTSDAQSPSGGDGQPSGSTPSENAPTEPSSESGSQSGGLVGIRFEGPEETQIRQFALADSLKHGFLFFRSD